MIHKPVRLLTELSTRAKEILQRNAEFRRRDNKFVKLQAGEKRIFQLDPEKIEQVEAEFNGKKSIRFRYTFAMAPFYSDELLPYFTAIHLAELAGIAAALLKITLD